MRSQSIAQGTITLAKAARGEPPGPDLQRELDAVFASVCPYRGLLHFREEDAPFFFGREAAMEGLVEGEAPPEPGLPAWPSPNNFTPHKFSLGLFDHFTALEQGVEFSRRAFLSYHASGRVIVFDSNK